MMDKVIKEIRINNSAYLLGYDLYWEEIYPRIEGYKEKKLILVGYRADGLENNSFGFQVYGQNCGIVGNIKELFNKLREHNEIPEEIEKEFESLFILYKLNDFNEF
jgi:hypothetical protein